MASTTTNQTALCLIPPEDVWKQIQAIRSASDRAYPRWMPHINFIYPFVSESSFDTIKAQLETVVHQQKPFTVRFDQNSFHYFPQQDQKCTYHLRPTHSTNVIELQQVIQNQLSKICKKKHPFEAHLTLGQCKIKDVDNILTNLRSNWLPIEFLVDRVYMISRENHPENLFTIKNEILLLDRKDDSTVSSKPMNKLCILPPNEFSSRLLHLFQRTSLQPLQPLRIILGEYEADSVNNDLRSKLESTSKFSLEFGQDSLGYDEVNSRLFLMPTNIEQIKQLQVLDQTKYDGSLTLGHLNRNDLSEVKERYAKNWPNEMNRFEIERIHLVDPADKFKFIFRLKS
ncbi:unnamed protein product [Adineta ricciae]|uniref:Uncharacterized protein n=1 Tax=Adineta ricciae TaxID=249248 RepID=A0A814D7W3_ADIRI|nr:unnamed protein product [Adineta ricciae]CAF0953452.1 unnamed protein product [Adineta ricciae]